VTPQQADGADSGENAEPSVGSSMATVPVPGAAGEGGEEAHSTERGGARAPASVAPAQEAGAVACILIVDAEAPQPAAVVPRLDDGLVAGMWHGQLAHFQSSPFVVLSQDVMVHIYLMIALWAA